VAAAAVFEHFIDHAALFPPASMPLDEALAEDRAARESEAAFMIGRFVVPAGRLGDLPGHHPPLSVVLADAADADGLRGAGGMEAVELPLDGPSPAPADLLATYRSLQPLGVEVYFELVLDDGWRDSVPALVGAIAALGARVKLRCGGAYTPSVEQVALVIAACRDAGVPFKCTAGLHHAVRRGEEHGFLNILAATGAPGPRLEGVLAEEDPEALDLDAADRSLFKSFGSCSWREPVDDLEALGLLA
jgi:hypothetical protein